MIKSGNPRGRLGAVMALGQLKTRAVPALDVLAGLLEDDDRWLRVQAAEALRTIGEAAKPVLPQMLKAAAARDETDPMEFAVGALDYALFYPGGAYGPKGVLASSIEGIARDLLYPAIRSVAANPDSHARGCLRSTYALLTLDDAKVLAATIVASIREMAPANTMFSNDRAHALVLGFHPSNNPGSSSISCPVVSSSLGLTMVGAAGTDGPPAALLSLIHI